MDTYEVKSEIFNECRKLVDYSMFWQWYLMQRDADCVPFKCSLDHRRTMYAYLYASKCGSYIARSIVKSTHGK